MNHRNRKFVKPAVCRPLVAGGCCGHLPGGFWLRWVSRVGWPAVSRVPGHAGVPAWRCRAGGVRDLLVFPSRWCGVPAAPLRLYV